MRSFHSVTSRQPFSAPAKIFHWLTVVLLVVQYSIGWWMPDVKREMQPVGLIGLHLSVGSLVVLVVLARLAWRASHPVPEEPRSLSRTLQLAARATHWALYVLLIAFPLMGWANASSRGWRVSLFGAIPLPPLAPTGSPLGHQMGDIHKVFAWVLLAVIALHVSAALFHHFVVKDDTLRRMLPQKK